MKRTDATSERVLDDRYKRYPLEKLIHPRAGFLECYTDHWWAVTDDGDVLFFRKLFNSPQCNSQREIVERLCPKGATPKFIPVAFVPADPHDYL